MKKERREIAQAEYMDCLDMLMPSAAPMMGDLPFSHADDDGTLYVPAMSMSNTSQVIGIVLAFMTEIIPIVFKKEKWKVSVLKMPKIAILAIKMVVSIIKALKK
jgi:hypothetical protein